MPAYALIGAQWGDEGKGKVVDYLAAQAQWVVRYAGGNNAGHTVINEDGTFSLHLVPSGVFQPTARRLSPGMRWETFGCWSGWTGGRGRGSYRRASLVPCGVARR